MLCMLRRAAARLTHASGRDGFAERSSAFWGSVRHSTDDGKTSAAALRWREGDQTRHTFKTTSDALATEFEEERMKTATASSKLVSRLDKLGTACLTMTNVARGNALSHAMMTSVLEELKLCDANPEVKAMILTGAGGFFSAGLDIEELSHVRTFEEAKRVRLLEFWDQLLDINKPIIAAVNGQCLGGGLELALSCDIVVAASSAHFAMPDIKYALLPGGGGTQRLTRRVGKARAMEMILLGASVDAFDARRIGICTRVVPDEEVVMVAFDMAQELGSLSSPIVSMAKEAVNASFEMPLEEGIMLEKREFWSSFALEDPHEGMAAFLEKREPRFKHK